MSDPQKEFDEFIASIRNDVIACLQDRLFFEKLDNLLCPADSSIPALHCSHTFSISTPLLKSLGFSDSDIEDIFDVLRSLGGFCDCEILYNASEDNRLKGDYWASRSEPDR
jgi:hypothetical protein